MLEQAKRPASALKGASAPSADAALRRPIDREVDPFGPKLESPPAGPQSFSEEKAPTGAEAQAHEIGEAIAADLPRGLKLSSGAVPSAVSEVAERHVGVSLGSPQMNLGGDGQRVAKQQGALAVAEGDTVHVAAGELSTGTEHGRSVLGHELTHVAQQRVHDVRVPQLMIKPAPRPPAPEPSSGSSYPEGEGGASGFQPPEAGSGGERGRGGAGGISLGSLTTEEAKIDAIRGLLGPKPTPHAGEIPSPTAPDGTGGAGGTPRSDERKGEPASSYAFTVAQAWESFGSSIGRVAKKYPELWERSKGHLSKLPQVVALKEPFAADAIAEARARLAKGKLIIEAELQSLGVPKEQLECTADSQTMSSEPANSSPADDESSEAGKTAVDDKLGEVADALESLKQLSALLDALKQIDVYNTEEIQAGIQGASSAQGFERFDPNSPHADHVPTPPTAEPVPDPAAQPPKLDISEMQGPEGFPLQFEVVDEIPSQSEIEAKEPTSGAAGAPATPVSSIPDIAPETQNWSSVKKVWDALTDATKAVKNQFPQANLIRATGKSEAFISASRSQRLELAKQALLFTLKKIQRVQPTISSNWSHFEQVTQGLLAGKGGSRDWSDPLANLAGELAVRAAKTPLANAVMEAGPVGAADAVVPIADAASFIDSASTLWTHGEELSNAKAAAATPDTGLTKDATSSVWVELIKSAISLALALVPFGKVAQLGYRFKAYLAISGAAKRAAKIGTKAAWRAEARALGMASAEELQAAAWLTKNPFRWRAHHAVPQQLQGEPLFALGTTLGVWNIHEVLNVVALPYYYVTRRHLLSKFGIVLPVHRGSHPWYTSLVMEDAERMFKQLSKEARDAGFSSVRTYAKTSTGRSRVREACSEVTTNARGLASGWPEPSLGTRPQ